LDDHFPVPDQRKKIHYLGSPITNCEGDKYYQAPFSQPRFVNVHCDATIALPILAASIV